MRSWLALFFLYPLFASTPGVADNNERPFDWHELPSLPIAIKGAYIGVSGDTLIVAGGFYSSPQERLAEKEFSNHIYSLTPGARQWVLAGKLDEPLAFGSAVAIDAGLVCIGGRNEYGESSRVFLLRQDTTEGLFRQVELTSLPGPLARCSATRLVDRLCVVGAQGIGRETNQAQNVFWSIDTASLLKNHDSRWQNLPPCPSKGNTVPIAVSQSGAVFVIGGAAEGAEADGQLQTPDKEVFGYFPNSNGASSWKRVADLPGPAFASAGVPLGSSTVLVFGGPAVKNKPGSVSNQASSNDGLSILAYETITDTWTLRGKVSSPAGLATAVDWSEQIVIIGGRDRSDGSGTKVMGGRRRPRASSFHLLDYSVLIGYLMLLVWIGYFVSRRKKSSEEFLLGGQRIPWWAAGLSILATQVSSIGFMAIPAKSFATDWVYFTGSLTWFVVIPIVVRYYLPFFHRSNVTTAYEYLEHRFNLFVRLYGSSAFVMLQLGRMAIVLYLPAIALSVVTGLDVYVSILVMGILSTLYTVMGGIEAVIWTDVLQAGVLMGGALLGVAVAVLGVDGGLSEFFTVAQSSEKFKMINWETNITTTAIWVVLVGNVFQRTADLTADQAVVQRYLTTRNKVQASRALWVSVAASLPWAVIVFLFGTALFVFFKTHPEKLDIAFQTDAIVPWFIMTEMPVGISGLMIAALFAAAMSSLDSSIHSVATTITVDFYKRFQPMSSDQTRLALARWLTAILGGLGTVSALLLATVEIDSLWDLFLKIAGLAIGGLAGLFMLGIFTQRGNSLGAIVGAISGGAILYVVQFHTRIHFLLYSTVGIVSTFAIGYVVSVIFGRTHSLEGLTIHSLNQSGHRDAALD